MTWSPSSESPFCSLHSCKCLSKPENNCVWSHWKRKKKWTSLCSCTDTFVAYPPLAICFALGLLRDPRPGPKSWRPKRTWETIRLWQTWLVFCSVLHGNGHLEVCSMAEKKGEVIGEDLGPLNWCKLLLPLCATWKCICQKKSEPSFWGLNPAFRQAVRYTKSPPSSP